MDEPAAKRISVSEHQDTIDATLRLYDVPLDVWSILAEQGGLEVADLISLQRTCKSLNMKLSDNTSSASLMWHSAVKHTPYASHPQTSHRFSFAYSFPLLNRQFSTIRAIESAVYGEVCRVGGVICRAVDLLRQFWRAICVIDLESPFSSTALGVYHSVQELEEANSEFQVRSPVLLALGAHV
jgi:hypothetical protein